MGPFYCLHLTNDQRLSPRAARGRVTARISEELKRKIVSRGTVFGAQSAARKVSLLIEVLFGNDLTEVLTDVLPMTPDSHILSIV